MTNPLQILVDIARVAVEVSQENERLRRDDIRNKRNAKEKQRAQQQAEENKAWLQATREEQDNPDEWRVLPYGWSPFGFKI